MALAFWSQNKEALGLGMAPDNSGVVTLHDSKGQPALTAGASPADGYLRVDTSSGTAAADMGVTPSGFGSLDVLGSGGVPLAQLAGHAQGGELATATLAVRLGGRGTCVWAGRLQRDHRPRPLTSTLADRGSAILRPFRFPGGQSVG
jgi:hypothetical protein